MPQSKTPPVYPPEVVARFWSHVAIGHEDECWLWGDSSRSDYGSFWNGVRNARANRVAWEIVHGPIPPGMHVLHQCDVPRCVNAYRHLFLGTNAENCRDKAQKLRVPIAKLDPDIVRDMRRRYAEGNVSTDQLARELGVDKRAISFALKGQTWAHVEGGEVEEMIGPRIGRSGYRGVSHHDSGLWRARMFIGGKQTLVGYFATPEEAAYAYDKAARELLGDRARLNFPEEEAA